jgi:hypothetical protein
MSTHGDGGDSFGLTQMRRPYHCCLPVMARSTAFNADYYGAIIRAYFDGKQTWLHTVQNGAPYRAGDLWGSFGAWYSGRWRLPGSQGYLDKIADYRARRVWLDQWF